MSNFINELGISFFDEISQYDYSDLVEGDISGTIDLDEYDTLSKPYIMYLIKGDQTVEVNLFHGEFCDEEAELDEKEEIEKEFKDNLNSFLQTVLESYEDEYKTTNIKHLKCIKNVIGEDDEKFCTEGKVYNIIKKDICGDELYFMIIDDRGNEHYFSVCGYDNGLTYKDFFIAA